MQMPTSQRKVALRADVERELAQRVQQAALADGRSIAGWIRKTLREELDEPEPRETADDD